ncbi:MAG: DNA cytosine methyltransferase [Burkholderiales bacterium]|nr:DNA cytosine methyltransferase [Burkholderiales bacterium]
MVASLVERKLSKIRRGSVPRFLDLFSGCGGIATGFVQAGMYSLGGVEIDADAARCYALNFHDELGQASLDLKAAMARPRDITQLDPHALVAEYGCSAADVDMIVGGPPCPTFARIGRAKLRQVHGRDDAFLHDPRGGLYVHYLEFVEALQPVALLMENVPEILNYGGRNVAEEICQALEALGYRCAYSLLNALHYGVPQLRQRFILVAVHQAAGVLPSFPVPTCEGQLPVGYGSARAAALSTAGLTASHYVEAPRPASGARPAATVADALGDLPILTPRRGCTSRRFATDLSAAVAYRCDVPLSEYARRMRQWRCFEAHSTVTAHVTRTVSERDDRLFRLLNPGDQYPDAHALAVELYSAELRRLDLVGQAPEPGSDEHDALLRRYVPPYDATKFPNKWRKLAPHEPSRTLMAHLGKDTYSHIHYDSAQARMISVREAARLQSFPDGFLFTGGLNSALRQIGNAVPPLLASALAARILATLRTETGTSASALRVSRQEDGIRMAISIPTG